MSTKADIWMPLYWADLVRDTLHLSRSQFGAYLLLIGHYWAHRKPLPDNDAILRNVGRYVGRYGEREWVVDKPVLAAFFQIHHGCWHHKRVEHELQTAVQNKQNARQRTQNATDARRKMAGHTCGSANVTKNVTTTSSPSSSPTPVQSTAGVGTGRKPKDLAECLAVASMIGISESDARKWYADAAACNWRRGDGTLFDNWQRQLCIYRDHLRQGGPGYQPGPGGYQPPASPTAELILRQNELKRVEERMSKIRASYGDHQNWDAADVATFNKCKTRKKELVKLLGMTI